MHRYSQSTGQWTHPKHGELGFFYSGCGEGKNNPAMQAAHAVGPIPRGVWRIHPPEDREHTGPFSLALTPEPGTDALGRSGFYVHGDKKGQAPGLNSLGCIVGSRINRLAIWGTGDDLVEVVE